jgi:hypothetical protein
MIDIHGNKIVGLEKVAEATKGLRQDNRLVLWYDQTNGKVWLDEPGKSPWNLADNSDDYVIMIGGVCRPMTTQALLDCINNELERHDCFIWRRGR